MIESPQNSFVFAAFCAFLLLSLVVGFYYGRGVKTLKDYALGGRNFTTPVLVASCVASIVGGGSLFSSTEQIYNTGALYIIAWMGVPIYLLILAYIFIPRMGEFLGTLSVADAMGKIYGKKVRIISAISSSLACICFIAMQFKVLSALLSYVFNIEYYGATILAALVTIAYSSFGGMRSVTLTDFIQFFTFLVILPLIAMILWGKYSSDALSLARPLDPIFEIKNFIGLNNPKFWQLVPLFLLFATPAFSPYMFQRITAARSVMQAKKAFEASSFIFLMVILLISIIAFCAQSLMYGLDVKDREYAVIYYIIDNCTNNYTLTALVIGTAAMTMSTADSCLNTASVTITNDIACQLAASITESKKMMLVKIFNASIGLLSICIALYGQNLLEMLFWGIKVELHNIPLMIAVLGFRTSGLSVLIAMGMHFTTMLLIEFDIIKISPYINSIIPGEIMSVIGLLASHYLLKQKGGWVGISDRQSYILAVAGRRRMAAKVKNAVKHFNWISFCNDTAPKSQLTYTGFGIFLAMSSVATMSSMAQDVIRDPASFNIFQILLGISFIYVSYPIWPHYAKNFALVKISWPLVLFVISPLFSTFFLFKSNISHLQTVILVLSIVIAMILSPSKFGLAAVFASTWCGKMVFEGVYGQQVILPSDSYYSFLYAAGFICFVFMVFLQPKLSNERISGFFNKILQEKVQDQAAIIQEASKTRQEFITRVKAYCTSEMNELNRDIKAFYLAMQNGTKSIRGRSCERELAYITRRLGQCGQHMISICDQMQQTLKIHYSSILLNDLIEHLQSDAENLGICASIDCKSEIKNATIECDQILILKLLRQIFVDGAKYSNDGDYTYAQILIKDSMLEYNLSFSDEFNKSSPAIKIAIVFDCSNRGEMLARRAQESIAHWRDMISAHYAAIKVRQAGSKLIYEIIIPEHLGNLVPSKEEIPEQMGDFLALFYQVVKGQNMLLKNRLYISKIEDKTERRSTGKTGTA